MGIALLISLPLGVTTAIFLNESRSRLRRPVRIFVDAMSGMPSIVSGLFIYATLIIPLAKDSSLFSFNGFMASLALSVTMMPTICRSVEVVLRLVPAGLREAGLALGSSRAKVVWSVVLPTAVLGPGDRRYPGHRPGGRGDRPPPLHRIRLQPDERQPVHRSPGEPAPVHLPLHPRAARVLIQRGFAGALVLMILILSLFVIARIIGRDRTKAKKKRRKPTQVLAKAINPARERS